jgi:hypothetical protein
VGQLDMMYKSCALEYLSKYLLVLAFEPQQMVCSGRHGSAEPSSVEQAIDRQLFGVLLI